MRPVGAQSLKKMKEEKAEKAPAPPKRKRASFRRGKLRKGKARKGKARKSKARESKAGEKLGDDEKAGDGKVTMYASYNLLELNIPDEARPVTLGKGSHSYTLKNADCTASIEVLLRHRAFFCKKPHPSLAGNFQGRQMGWKTYGSVQAAWRAAKEGVGWDL